MSAAVLRELVLKAAIAKTAGDLFDRLARIDPTDRRRLLDTMRSRSTFEITLTPTPANPDAVVLSTESLDDVRVRRFEA